MKKQTGDKVLGLIFEEDIQGLRKMNLAKKNDITDYQLDFFNFAIEKEKYKAAEYLYEKVIKEAGIPDYDVERLYSFYYDDMGNLSFMKKDLSFFSPFLSADFIYTLYGKALNDYELFSDFTELFKKDVKNKDVLREIFDKVLYKEYFSEEDVIKFWGKILEQVEYNLNYVGQFLGEPMTLLTELSERKDCAKILEFLKEKGTKLYIEDDGYSFYLEKAIENRNEQMVKFLIENGANIFVPRREGYLSAYSMGEISGFWNECKELQEDILKKFGYPSDYVSNDYKAHIAFIDNDMDSFVKLIEDGAAFINNNIKCQKDITGYGYFARLLELSVNSSEHFEIAKIILDKYGDNKDRVLHERSEYTNPLVFEKCIELGLNPGAMTKEGTTCFYSCCRNYIEYDGIFPIIKRLVEEKGCNPAEASYTVNPRTLLDDLFERKRRYEEPSEEYFQLIDYFWEKGCKVNQEVLDSAIKYPTTVSFFERVVLKYADISKIDFNELLEHYDNMIKQNEKNVQHYQTELEAIYKKYGTESEKWSEKEKGHIDNTLRLLNEEKFSLEKYEKLKDIVKEMSTDNSPSM